MVSVVTFSSPNYRENIGVDLTYIFMHSILGPSYNQPKLCPSTTWNRNATTIANVDIVGQTPWALFVDVNNTVFTVDKARNVIRIRKEGVGNSWRNISGDIFFSFSIFATLNGDIYQRPKRIEKS